MKIQVGEVTLNKTWKYLAPLLKHYGQEFEQKINSIYKIGFGIGDMILINNGVNYEQHIFVLIDTKTASNFFKLFIKWIRRQDMFEDDYIFDNIVNGRFHMVVLKLPEQYYKSNILFKKGQFSKMYNKEDVQRFFKEEDIKGVLIKEGNYIIKHTKKLNEMFGTNLKPYEIEGEWDFPIEKREEVFSNHLKTNAES